MNGDFKRQDNKFLIHRPDRTLKGQTLNELFNCCRFSSIPLVFSTGSGFGPVVGTKRGGRQTIYRLQVGIFGIISPGIANRHRHRHLVGMYFNSVWPRDFGFGPIKFLVGPCNSKTCEVTIPIFVSRPSAPPLRPASLFRWLGLFGSCH